MLKLRILTALVLIPLVLALIFYAPGWLFASVLALLALAGAWEWAALAGFTDRLRRALCVLGCSLLMAVLCFLNQQLPYPQVLVLLCLSALAWWLLSALWVAFWHMELGRPLKLVCGLLTLLPSLAAVVALRAVSPLGLLMLLLVVWAADIGAYFTGRAFGRHKLAPLVSPGKTWEGLVGGLVAAVLVAVVGGTWLPVSRMPFILICMFVCLFSVVGDLSESLFKRQAGVKDSGVLFPGHGGVLDRVDSLTAAAPVYWLGLYWLGAWS